MKKIFLLLSFILSMQVTDAQNNLPKWITGTHKQGETAACGVDRQSAIQTAIGQLYDQFNVRVDSTSLLYALHLADSTMVIDQRSAWVERAVGHEAFEIKDSLMQDSLYWIRVQVKAANLKVFVEELQTTAIAEGKQCRERALEFLEKGDVVGASLEYAKGLNAISHSMHKTLPLEDGTDDIGVSLYREYMTLFDGIRLSAQYDSVPMVPGEEIPFDLKFSLTVNDKPLTNFPVEGWIEEGRFTSGERSDAQGMVSLHVKQAPAQNGKKAGILVNRGLLSSLEDCFAKPQLLQHLERGFEMAETRLVAFDPTATFYVETDSLDQEHVDSLSVVLARQGLKQVARKGEADIVCKLTWQGKRGASVKAGSYQLAKTTCSMQIRVTVQHNGQVLGNYEIAGFDLSHPANKSEADVRNRALQLMMRRASEELPVRFANIAYDKRKEVYDKVVKK